ncbi:MAG TPA: glycosyltransferase family 2 protein, partial [Bacteroidia bacterium]|nr:glycosyltransferase family 2 protein [Bacteroidia bacterium]
DNTVRIVEAYTGAHKNITLLHNVNRTVPYALNMAIPICKYDVIVRLDAHTCYAMDYFEKIIETFDKTNAHIVGGPMHAIGKTTLQKAIAQATSSVMGVGNSTFHDINASGYVDSVYLGAWQKSIFEKTGLFDVRFKRNQDDEFHYRAKQMGLKIYLNPEIKSYYYPRNSYTKLSKQYFQYGLYKPMVLQKVKSAIKLRHLIPAAFVLYIMAILPFSLVWFFLIIPLLLYVLLASFYSVKSNGSCKQKLFQFIAYPVIHFSYGCGFIFGFIKHPVA